MITELEFGKIAQPAADTQHLGWLLPVLTRWGRLHWLLLPGCSCLCS